MKDLYDAKKTLKEKGWSYRSASPYLNVTATHLCLVLTGRRQSKRLLAAIQALPHASTLN